MLKRQKPTTAPARFQSKSMNSMLKCIMERAQQEESGFSVSDGIKKGVDVLLNPIGTLTKKTTDAAPRVARQQAEPFSRQRRTTPLETGTPGQGGGGRFDSSDDMPSRGFGGPAGGSFEPLGAGSLYTTLLPLAMLRTGAVAQQLDYEAWRRIGPIGQLALSGSLAGTNSFLTPFITGKKEVDPASLNIDPELESKANEVAAEAAAQDERTDESEDEPSDPRSGDPRSGDPRTDEPEESTTTTGANLPKATPFVSYAKKITRSDRSTMQA